MASSPPFTVKAVYEYKSPHEDDLNFPVGQIVTVTEQEDDDWYVGEYTNSSGAKQSGLFPKNFVERYEPEAPPRPSRPRPKKEGSSAAVQPEPQPQPPPPAEPEPTVEESIPEPTPASPQPAPAAQPAAAAAAPPSSSESSAPPAKSNAPPPIAEKPSSFKDRLALFNKASAAPVAPVKPGAQPTGSSSTFIKKPFVAPPPSRNAYVPPPTRDLPPQKVYRREEDPEIAERQAQDLEDAKSAGLVAPEAQDGEEEAAKPTSLRDRIALLQKQQQEQASRRAEVSQKEKPKRPPKKRTESGDPSMEPETPELERTISPEVASPRMSTDSVQEVARPPLPRKPSHPKESTQDILSDGNEADQSGAGDTTEDQDEAESTEVEDANEKAKARAPAPIPRTSTGSSSRGMPAEAIVPPRQAGHVEEPEEDDDDEEDEEEEEMDEDTRKKMELRERMAKMSGGMGMPGMFAMPMPAPATKKKRPSASEEPSASASPPTQRAPMVPIPGMSHEITEEPDEADLEVEKEPESARTVAAQKDPRVVEDVEDLEQLPTAKDRSVPPPPPQDHPLPPAPSASTRPAPPVPTQSTESRPVPPPPPRPAAAESEADNETVPRATTTENKRSSRAVPPVPGDQGVSSKPETARSPPSSTRRASQISETAIPTSPPVPPPTDKRSSRQPPATPSEAPSMPPAPPTEGRPPPPPPPTAAPPSRKGTGIEESNPDQDSDVDDGESDYEGDYDTDIASGASHKNALKAHVRDPSMDDGTFSEDASKTPAMPPVPPPAHRGAPPPPPPQETPSESRKSAEAPRMPPPAPPREPEPNQDEEYDPYRYSNPTLGILPTHRKTRASQFPAAQQESDPSLYDETPAPTDRAPPPVPQSPPPVAAEPPRQSRELPRQSMEPPRTSLAANRKSTEMPRGSSEQGHMAQDVDLAVESVWWANPETPPPVFQKRSDILCEFEESSTSKRGGRTTISKDVYILFPDYSQTIITVRFDPKVPSDASLEQRHEPPPAKPRQDQLEAAHSKLGQAISAAAHGKQNTTVGDGTAQALVVELLRTQPKTLMPVGTRAYGALVYANMANATVQQFDEIRPGDIISFKNAKFSGKHGAMHAKYSEDVGKPEHVGIVTEWDGTKKKVRALEQGRESRKAKVESFRAGDLRSGEVKVWRIMDRSWVGWESG